MAITYNAGTNVLTVTGAGNTFAAIYAADVAGGWGVVTNQGTQYLLACNLVIGDSSTTTDLTDNSVQVQIGTAAANKYLQTKAAATFQLGTISNGTYNTTYGHKATSLTIYALGSYVDTAGTWKMYGCSVYIATLTQHTRINGAVATIDWRNCSFSGPGCIWVYALASGQIRRCVMTWTNYGLLCYTGNVTMEDIKIESPTYGMVLGLATNITAREVWINPSTTTDFNLGNGSGMRPSYRLYDCEYDRENIYTYSADLAHVTDFKSLDILVTDEQGSPIQDAIVTMEDSVNALPAGWDTNLIGYWKLWGNGDDEGPNNYDFTTITTPVAGTNRWSQPNRAMAFDGNDLMETTATGVFPGGDFTIACWAKVTAGATYALVAHHNTASLYDGFILGNPYTNNNIYLFTSDGTGAGAYSNCGPFADGTWHHILVSLVAATKVLEIWRDGRWLYTGAIARGIGTTTNPLRLGRRFDVTHWLTGSMAELMLWNRVVTHPEVEKIYAYQKPWFTTDANGEASGELETYLMYDNGTGNGKGPTYNTYIDYSPYSYRVEKDGYETVRGELDLDVPRQLNVCMRRVGVAGQGQIR